MPSSRASGATAIRTARCIPLLNRQAAAKLNRPRVPGSLTDMADMISFARGAPSLDIVDVDGLREAAQAAFDADPSGTTAYGTAVGYVPLREWIAERHGVRPEQVLVTNGSMQADAFLFETVVGPGDIVFVEAPTYDRTLLNLRHRQADVRPIALEVD